MKQKLTALSLEQLAKEMPVLSEQEQQAYWGGGTGTKDDPYTYQEYSQMLDSGTWSGVLFMAISGPENWAVWDSGAGRLDRLNAARGNKNK